MLHGLPSEAPWNQGYESTPDFHCAHADCPEAAWAPNDFKLCETCGKHYCADHIARLDDLYLCDECRVCAHCKRPAVAQCDMCADLVCTAHVRHYADADHSTGYAEQGEACSPRCKPIVINPAEVVALEELEHAPF